MSEQRLVLTGPLHEPERFAAAAREAGWEVFERPLIATRARAFELGEQQPDLIAVASSSSIPALGEHLERLAPVPCGAVGARTAERLEAAGFRVEWSAARDAAELEQQLGRAFPGGGLRVLCPHGSRSIALVDALRARGFEVDARLAYVTEATADTRPLPACEALLLASPSAVERARAIGLEAAPDRWLAIGATTAAAIERCFRVAPLALDAPTPAALRRALAD